MKTYGSMDAARADPAVVALEISGATIRGYVAGDAQPGYMQRPAGSAVDESAITDAAGAAKLSPALWAAIKAAVKAA